MKTVLIITLSLASICCFATDNETTSDIETQNNSWEIFNDKSEQTNIIESQNHSEKKTNSIEKDPYKSTDRYHFKIQKKDYLFSSFFEIDSEDTYRGAIKKSSFRLRVNYDLSDRNGWCATGVKRIFSLGSLLNRFAEIEIYGVQGEFLGLIQGKLITTGKATFYIYDKNQELIGIACIDRKGQGATISAPDNEAYTLARLDRVFVQDIPDYWKVVVYEPENLDDRIIRIFAGFCLDVQDSFHKDK